MTQSVFVDLTIIKIFWKGSTYTIKAEEVKTDDKQKNEKYKASDSHDSYAISFGECEYSIDVKGISPGHKHLFMHMREYARRGYAKTLFKFATYEYVDGKLTLLEYYDKAYLEDISRTGNEPFDVKIGSLSRLYRNSKNKLI